MMSVLTNDIFIISETKFCHKLLADFLHKLIHQPVDAIINIWNKSVLTLLRNHRYYNFQRNSYSTNSVYPNTEEAATARALLLAKDKNDTETWLFWGIRYTHFQPKTNYLNEHKQSQTAVEHTANIHMQSTITIQNVESHKALFNLTQIKMRFQFHWMT